MKGKPVAKTKKKKNNDKKDKRKAAATVLTKAPKKAAKVLTKAPKKAAKSLKAVSQNPLVADVVAAALVAMASALKDSDKARRLASEAGEELNALAKKSAKEGNAMWEMALDIGRRTLGELTGDEVPRSKSSKSR
jgi:hypothetical protein